MKLLTVEEVADTEAQNSETRLQVLLISFCLCFLSLGKTLQCFVLQFVQLNNEKIDIYKRNWKRLFVVNLSNILF